MIANWQVLINEFASQCDWVGIREYREVSDNLSARNGKPEASNSKLSHGAMIEVLINGQFAYSGTVDLSTSGMRQAFKRASLMAASASAHKLFSFDDKSRPANKGAYQSKIEKALDSLSFAEIQKKLINISTQAETSKEIIDSWALAMLINTQIYYVSSNGSEWQQDFSIVTKDFGVTAKRGNETQSRSFGFNGLQIGLEDLRDDILEGEAIRVGNQAVELLGAKDCPNDTRDLMLTPDQLYLQIHESIGHPLEIDRILGDERNYAGWSFISPGDFGHLQYGSNLMNVTFDPSTPTGMASYAFDDNGVPAEKAHLIKDGVLLRGIGGIESQQRSGLPGVACARSSDWNRPPIDRMANINLEPGDATMFDMIKNTEKGILMQSNRSWSIDDYRNKFQFGCEYAQLIEDGELTDTVKNPNYRGVTTAFWNKLKYVGDQDTTEVYGSPYCGKGEPNQIIRVGHSTPTCVFGNVEIFGGA
jgi:predicted Zn-dependent protease